MPRLDVADVFELLDLGAAPLEDALLHVRHSLARGHPRLDRATLASFEFVLRVALEKAPEREFRVRLREGDVEVAHRFVRGTACPPPVGAATLLLAFGETPEAHDDLVARVAAADLAHVLTGAVMGDRWVECVVFAGHPPPSVLAALPQVLSLIQLTAGHFLRDSAGQHVEAVGYERTVHALPHYAPRRTPDQLPVTELPGEAWFTVYGGTSRVYVHGHARELGFAYDVYRRHPTEALYAMAYLGLRPDLPTVSLRDSSSGYRLRGRLLEPFALPSDSQASGGPHG